MTKKRETPPVVERAWIAPWLRKAMDNQGIGPGKLSKAAGITSQRISQATAGTDPPGTELLWRIAAALDEDDASAAMSGEQVKNLIQCLIVSLTPDRLRFLKDLPHLEARDLIDRHMRRKLREAHTGRK